MMRKLVHLFRTAQRSMKPNLSNRQFLSAAIIVFYLIPLLFFSIYSIKLMSHHKSWSLLSLGLLLVVFGTLSLIFLLLYWEQSMREKKPVHSLPLPLSHEKEAKVTLLDPSFTFNQKALHDDVGKENTTELHFIQTTLATHQEQHKEFIKTLEIKSQELNKQEEENKQLQMRAQHIAQDFADYKLFSEEQLKQKQLQLTALQQIIEDQRAEMEKRQEQIHQLDTKVHDLSYEIKTLLYLHEEEAAPLSTIPISKEEALHIVNGIQIQRQDQADTAMLEAPGDQGSNASDKCIQTSTEAAALLKKCIHIAQKLTGTNYYSNESSRYREFSSSYFAIDQRRLFDNLRNETGALIVVYSQKEHRLLFANHEAKTLLGWSPEKFVVDFASIMQEGMHDWKQALQGLANASESQARLLVKTKQGQEALVNCHLGVIPSGLFRNYVIGVLYPA